MSPSSEIVTGESRYVKQDAKKSSPIHGDYGNVFKSGTEQKSMNITEVQHFLGALLGPWF